LKNSKLLFPLLLFLLSAAMLTVIQPPIAWSILAWVSLVPFIIACSPQAKPKQLILIAYVVSLAYWLGNLHWVFPITIIGWIAFCVYTAILWPLVALCLRYCRAKSIPLLIAVPVLFVGAERAQGFLLGGFFWRFLGHSQYANITLIQIADMFGVAGLSFVVALVNALVADLIVASRQAKLFKPVSIGKVVMVSTTLLAMVCYGRWRINQSDRFVTQGPHVASLQSNVPQSVKRSFQKSDQLFNGLMEKSRAAAETGAELIVWPETMVQATLDSRVLRLLGPSHSYRVFDQALREHAEDTAYVLVGAYGGVPEIKDEGTIHLAKRYNSAFLYRPDGRQADEYYSKIHLVPFGEVLPFRKTVPWLYNLLMKFTPYNYDYSLDYGSEYTIFEMSPADEPHADQYRFGVLICYEDTVPALARRFALDKAGRKRVDWLVNISNDGWFVRFDEGKVSPSAELEQHAAICAFRAVENRLSILRSVNTGISCLIDSLGQMRERYLAASPDFPIKPMNRTGMAGWFSDEMPIDKRVTFFSKYGEWLDYCCLAAFFSLIVMLVVTAYVRPKIAACFSGKTNEQNSR
jgi:apolipoprotein N-acyltransferase